MPKKRKVNKRKVLIRLLIICEGDFTLRNDNGSED